MNKEQALQKLDALEKEAKALRKIIEEPEERLLKVNGDLDDMCIWMLRVCADKNISDGYFKAFKTLLLLRQQEGSEAPFNGKTQYLIRLDKFGGSYIDTLKHIDDKVSNISPCFKTYQHTVNAIDFIGKRNIIHMFKTFHGIYE